MSSISIFHTGFVICLAGTILFFVITIALFFIFDIRTIYAIRSGRAQAKSVKEMEMVNSSTGRLRAGKKKSSRQSSQRKKTNIPERSAPAVQQPVIQPPAAENRTPITHETVDYSESVTEKLSPNNAAAYSSNAQETAVLNDAGETAVLNDAGETAVLQHTTDEITAEQNINQTAAPVQQSTGPVYFEVVKKIVCLDTEEVIS